jgi:prepilin-type N-terminal cleavage/methylation domain-containing protein
MKERITKALRKKAGFSLIEIIIVSFIAAIVLYTVAYAFMTSTRSSVSLNRRSDVTAALQNSVDRMVDELRVSEGIAVAQNDRVTVQIEGNEVTFFHDATNKELERNGVVIAHNVEGVTFTYLDATGVETGNTADMRRIQVVVQGRRMDEVLDLESSATLRKLM